MTIDQILVLAVLAATLVFFVWGRWRYDVVALAALLMMVVLGIVPESRAFSGFGHPAVITVAAVLVLSRALTESGVVSVLAGTFARTQGKPAMQVGALVALVTGLSAFMNNVGALALTMPLALQLCARGHRPPSQVLMPLAFGSLLGGLITLIGTPPNLIISAYRVREMGSPFSMFDFAPVGLVVATVGGLYIALIGWRLLPRNQATAAPARLFEIDAYITEARLAAGTRLEGRTVRAVEQLADNEVAVVALLRNDRRLLAPGPFEPLKADDILILEGHPDALKSVISRAELSIEGGHDIRAENLSSERVGLVEVVVTPGSRLEGRSARDMQLHDRYGLNLLAIARQGEAMRQRLSRIHFRPGDVLLVQGDQKHMSDSLATLGCLPLAERDIRLGGPRMMRSVLAIFGAAIVVTTLGLAPAHISFALAVAALVITQRLSLRDAYGAIEGPVIVLLAAMIPVGQALETTGTATVIGLQLVEITQGAPLPIILGLFMLVTMLLSDVINNAATAVIMAPIAATVANQLNVNPDTMLMAVAVAASCTFLTPVGHQSNTLVMGPGGYSFGDYWRMGLPLDILVILTAVPTILWVWPP